MKIGVLTFHRAHNYGAMLQAYALRKTLNKRGYDVEFISYRQKSIEDAYKVRLWKYDISSSFHNNVLNLISNIITLLKRLRRAYVFKQFTSSYLPESKSYSKEQLLSNTLDYDVVFFGSDQIWTTRFLGKFDEVFWGDIHLTNGKKVAYAPSMELKELSDEEKQFIKTHIRNFDSLSARETSMSNLLESITGLKVRTVLDPTLLCERSDYKEILSTSKFKFSEPYVLVYQVGQHNEVMEIAKVIANQLKCRIIEIGSQVLLHSDSSYKDKFGPSEFVSLIANATFVVSCSFHGTAFAVNFHKPFYSVLISGIDSRVRSFLNQLNLQKRGVRKAEDVDVESIMNIDYSQVELLLNKLRTLSLEYIDQSLH